MLKFDGIFVDEFVLAVCVGLEFFDFQFGGIELFLTALGQPDAFLVMLDQILERHIVALHFLNDRLEFFQSLLKRHIVRGGSLLFFHSHAARKIVQLGQVDKRFGCSTAEAESQVAHPARVAGRGEVGFAFRFAGLVQSWM